MILSVKNLNVSFPAENGQCLKAISNLSFELKEGETLGMVGESGCGKSLTNLCLMGLWPTQAIIEFDELIILGKKIPRPDPKLWQDIRGSKVSMIFQDPMSALNPTMRVRKQIFEVFRFHRNDINKDQYEDEAIQLLNDVGIPDPQKRLDAYPYELSGGMAQRIMIAMALASKPQLLIADEPTTALDVTIQDQILTVLRELIEKYRMALILVTHDLGVVFQNTENIQIMYAGEIIERGKTKDVIHHPSHPYTDGLLKSLPESQKNQAKLYSIPGVVPDIHDRPPFCQFAPRCPKAQDLCDKEFPIWHKNNFSTAYCHFPMDQDNK